MVATVAVARLGGAVATPRVVTGGSGPMRTAGSGPGSIGGRTCLSSFEIA